MRVIRDALDAFLRHETNRGGPLLFTIFGVVLASIAIGASVTIHDAYWMTTTR